MRASVYAMVPAMAAFIALSGCLASTTSTDAEPEEPAPQRQEGPYPRFRLYDANGTLAYRSREPGEIRGAACPKLPPGNYTASAENSTATPGHRIVSYQWSGPDGFTANGSQAIIPIPAGHHRVGVTITDSAGATTGIGDCFFFPLTWVHNATVGGSFTANAKGTSFSERRVHNFTIEDARSEGLLVAMDLTFTLALKTGAADFSLMLLDAEGTKLADADAGGFGAGETITMETLPPGTYSLVVEGTALKAEYTLTWSMTYYRG